MYLTYLNPKPGIRGTLRVSGAYGCEIWDILFACSNSMPTYLRTTESTSSRQPTVSATTASLAEASPRTARPHTGFPMSAHLSRIRLFQRHLRSLVWVWVWVWDGIHSHASLRTRSPSPRHPPFTHYPFPPRSLVCGGQPSPHKPRLVVSHSTCPPLSSSPHAHSFVLGTAVINTLAETKNRSQAPYIPLGRYVP